MFRKQAVVLGLACAGLISLPVSAVLAADTLPRVDSSGANMQPAYPPTALPDKESGAVVISATVEPDGTVKAVNLRKSSGYADLDQAAANAVNGWKFIPATENGQPVEGKTAVQIVFTPPN
ncbi:MAG TPA: energy transducer TonB [Rhizomicrobium sp.]|nr:energy transducer TonB [Rhizomicrobium sp.]